MSDSKNLTALNCPNCDAPLSCKSTDMVVTCESCGTSVIIKDLVTKTRIDNQDKLNSYLNLSENALKTKDWKSAYKYYESICKIDCSEKNMSILNILNFMRGKSDFRQETVSECRKLDIEKRRFFLEEMKFYIDSLKASDIKKANSYADPNRRQSELRAANAKYFPMYNLINSELEEIRPVKCICGNTLEYNEDVCSECGKTRLEICEELKNSEKLAQKEKIMLIISLSWLGLDVLIGSVSASYIFYGEASSAVFPGIIAFIFLALYIILFNRKLKSKYVTIIAGKLEKIHLNNKTELLNKIFLPVAVIVPVIIIILLGTIMVPQESEEILDSGSGITEVIEETAEKTTEAPT